MAEAAVEQPVGTFFCHECNRVVLPNIPAFTCSRCNSGFIEEMENRAPAPSQSFVEPLVSESVEQLTDLLLPFFEPLRANAANPLQHRYNTRLASRRSNNINDENGIRFMAPGAVLHFTSRDSNQTGQHTLQGVINYVIQSLGHDLGGQAAPIFLQGNPGDYAWGPNGLDGIISQLLNHLEGTGAPPAQRDRIDNLARVIIDQSHIDNRLQCSICMDDFEMAMEARKLPCGHFYHSECIVKWLEMHGTCPVCRKDLNGDDTSTDEAEFIPDYHLNSGGVNATASSSSTSMETTSSTSSTSMETTAQSPFFDNRMN